MQVLASAPLMRQMDEVAITRYGVPGLLLMENAGRGVADAITQEVGNLRGTQVLVLCGRGNNGGDGFVIARHLLVRGATVCVGVLGKTTDLRGDARTNFAILQSLRRAHGGRLAFVTIATAGSLKRLPAARIIVDAIFGTGFTGSVRGVAVPVIAWVNRQQALVVSVDIASGVDASTGSVGNQAIRPTMTVALALAKVGHLVGEGGDTRGRLTVADICLPPAAIDHVLQRTRNGTSWTRLVGREDVAASLVSRPRRAHKYSVGKVLVIGGSRALTGAPVLAAQAAMRSGSGAVVLALPKGIHDLVARKVTEVMVLPLDETAEGAVAASAVAQLHDRITWADVVAIGPGLSRGEETLRTIRMLLTSVNKPCVVDADALYAVAGNHACVARRREETIVTPHEGEFCAIMSMSREELARDRIAAATHAARALNATVILKGAPTITALPDGSTYINPSGNPALATAGSGDVLCGIVASLRSTGMSMRDAATGGVYIHGVAGDIAKESLGESSVMALDLVSLLPDALRQVRQ